MKSCIIGVSVMPGHSALTRIASQPSVCASDFALSAGRGDYSVHIVAAVVANTVGDGDDYFILDVWRKQAPIEESVSALCSLMQRHRGVDAFIAESDSIILASGPYVADRMRASSARSGV